MASKTTLAVRGALGEDQQHGAVVPPLHLSSNFTFADFDEPRRYDYTRSGNPTRDALADTLASLEGGAGCVVTSTGMAAVNLVLQLLKPGDLLIAPHDCYGGSFRLFHSLAERGSFDVALIDQTDPVALADALARSPKLVWIESPSNPLLRLVDIESVARSAREAGALVAVDNTFLSPALQQPISLGADLVVHSTTKYLNGHSDVVGGAVVSATPELHEQIDWWANNIGCSGAPFDSYLTLRGVRTLDARLRIHESNTQAIAQLLNVHSAVTSVNYPGLTSHPDHELACRQQDGFGGMISFEIDGGEPALRRFFAALQHFFLAESLGGVESLACHPATMTHKVMDREARLAAGISDSLVRLSVGIESEQDLCADLAQALDAAALPLAVIAG